MSKSNLMYLVDNNRDIRRSSSAYQFVRSVDDVFAKPMGRRNSTPMVIDRRDVLDSFLRHIIDNTVDTIAKFKDVILVTEVKLYRNSNEELIGKIFRSVITIDPETDLPLEEIVELTKSPHPEDFIIGGNVDFKAETITLVRGNFSILPVSFGRFKSNPKHAPDFSRFKVIDHGTALRFGDYEASIYPLLYASDPEYRHRVSKQRKVDDKSFGACLYRARKILGLNQSALGLPRETINRLENERSKKVRISTKKKILSKLKMSEQELLNY
jgi:hypothetical protein